MSTPPSDESGETTTDQEPALPPLWEMWHAVRPDPPADSPLWTEERIVAAYRALQTEAAQP